MRPPRLDFRLLRTRLAVLYAGLFAVAMTCVSGTLYVVVERNAAAQVRDELVANGTAFDRLWSQRTAQLRDSAGLLAQDFGFRTAVATHHRRTVESALANLKSRLGLPMAFIVEPNGNVIGIRDPSIARQASTLAVGLDNDAVAGTISLGGVARHVVAAPILAPVLSGWVVFSTDLDRREMASLERLSAIPIAAAVYQRRADGAWVAAGEARRHPNPQLSRFIDETVRAGTPAELDDGHGTVIALAKPLPTMPGEPATILLLQYPLALAMASYRSLQIVIALLSLSVLGLVMLATWRMARSITRPISWLDDAASRLADGETVVVPVDTRDELGRLAASFNRMAAGIAERERRITHLAFNDILTGLPNRVLFHQHLDHQLRQVERRGGDVALFCLDLDDFKSVNDTLGHPVGDEVLRRVAQRLTDEVGEGFVARLGGDEFVIIQAIDICGDVEVLARRTLRAIEVPVRIEGHDIDLGVSIGIAVAPVDGKDAETLLRNADLALYRAKESGRRTYCFFEPSLNARAQARRSIEVDLRRALANGEFALQFQPLFDLSQNRIGSFEALLRWHHPERGVISPAEFIPIAEETGLIVPIGAWVMHEACRVAMQWPDHVKVAVNVSTVQIRRPGLAQTIVQALRNSGLAPSRLEIEITESIFLETSNTTLGLLHSLRSLGIRVALDDFGTGYSSLSYLQSFPFDKIKIDRSFISNLLTRSGAGAVVKAITDLASALGMETTAEGVEETSQLEQLRKHGCTSVQGFLFSKPVAPDKIFELLAVGEFGAARVA